MYCGSKVQFLSFFLVLRFAAGQDCAGKGLRSSAPHLIYSRCKQPRWPILGDITKEATMTRVAKGNHFPGAFANFWSIKMTFFLMHIHLSNLQS